MPDPQRGKTVNAYRVDGSTEARRRFALFVDDHMNEMADALPFGDMSDAIEYLNDAATLWAVNHDPVLTPEGLGAAIAVARIRTRIHFAATGGECVEFDRIVNVVAALFLDFVLGDAFALDLAAATAVPVGV